MELANKLTAGILYYINYHIMSSYHIGDKVYPINQAGLELAILLMSKCAPPSSVLASLEFGQLMKLCKLDRRHTNS